MDMTTPPDLTIMLDGESRRAFDNLPYRRQCRYIQSIVQAKTPETREHRIARAVRMLREESER